MAWTSADIVKLERAIADGAGVRALTSVSGETVTFNSIEDMLALLATMRQEVDGAAAGSPPRNIRFAVTSKAV